MSQKRIGKDPSKTIEISLHFYEMDISRVTDGKSQPSLYHIIHKTILMQFVSTSNWIICFQLQMKKLILLLMIGKY
jgi:hypothetical protein